MNSTRALFNLEQGYEILIVRETCSTAWVPHRVENPFPIGAVVAGKDGFNKNQYVVGRISPHIMIGRLIEGEGESAAHFSYGSGSTSFANMFILMSLV